MTKLKTILISLGLLTLIFINNFYLPHPAHAYSPELFVTRWKTDIAGTTDPTKVSLNFQLSGMTGYYEVDWTCDGTFDEVIYDAKTTHNYTTAGTYDICIKSFSPLSFQSTGLTVDERSKLLEIKQWGSIKWSSFGSSFQNMINMQLTATDTPDLSAVTDMSSAFQALPNFTGNDSMNTWNTSNVTNMKSMFENSVKFNAQIGN